VRRAAAAGLGAAALLAAGLAAAEPRAGPDGAALFAGEGLAARLPTMGNLPLEGGAAGCGRCHGEDARGRADGGVPAPAIRWRVLAAPSAARPGYDAGALRRALNEGVDPAGRPLHPFMPRYAVTAAQAAALAGHLDDGVERGHPAVGEAELRLLVPHLPDEAAMPALLDALWAEPARRAWGRRLRAVPLALPAAADSEAGTGIARALEASPPGLAAVGGPGPRRAAALDAALARAGLPHLFPVDGYAAPPRIPGVVLAEAPLSVQVTLLRRHAATEGPPTVLCGSGGPLEGDVGCVEAPPPGAGALLLPAAPAAWADGRRPWRVPPTATLFIPLDEAGAFLELDPAARDFAMVLADPRGRAMPAAVLEELRRAAPALLAERPELARRAHAAAALTAMALQRAGPRPTPAGVLAAAGAVPAGEAGALAGPWRDGVRPDAAYGVQMMRLPPRSGQAVLDGAWARP